MTSTERWKPRVTVAAVIENQGRFLLVKESINDAIRYNQPAGHLEDQESLLEAVQREVLEETGWPFQADGLVGIYRWVEPRSGETFLRFTFCGTVAHHQEQQTLDTPVIETCWMSHADVKACADQHRSPQVLRSLDDYLAGCRHPLELIREIGDQQL